MAPMTRLASLPTRPPTPPKELSSDSSAPVPKPSSQLLNTPETPLVFQPDYFSQSSSRGTKRKRVNFAVPQSNASALDTPSSPPSLPEIHDSNQTSLSTYQPSTFSKPRKSILKVTNYGLLSDLSLDSDDFNISLKSQSPLGWHANKVKMLEDIEKSLRALDKSSRLDAYVSLTKAMKDFEDIPSLAAFTQMVPLLMLHVQRDLNARKGTDHRDGQLAVEALKLANIIGWKNPSTLTDSARSDLLEWCVLTLEDESSSKVLLNNTLFLVIGHTFSKILTNAIITRIMIVLRDIDSRISGTQVKVLRLGFYKKTLGRSEPLMVANVRQWAVNLFEGLLSDKNDLADCAITLGREAAIALGTTREVSKTVEGLLATNSKRPEGDGTVDGKESRPYCIMVKARLKQLLDNRGKSDRVPQVWSIVMLFLRRRPSCFSKWAFYREWISLIQSCFNHRETATRVNAMAAWRDLIFGMQDEMMTSSSIHELLCKPLIPLLQRSEGATGDEIAATFYAFLYYAFKPGYSSYYNIAWEQCLAKVIAASVNFKRAASVEVVQVALGALLGSFQQVAWNPKRALSKEPFSPKTLPRIEVQWVFSNLELILQAFEQSVVPIPDASPSGYLVWGALNKTIVEAKRNDVRPSTATMRAFSQLLEFAKKQAQLCSKPSASHDIQASMPSHAAELLKVTFGIFGTIPSNEKHFARDETGSGFHFAERSQQDFYSAIDMVLEFMGTQCRDNTACLHVQELFSVLLDRRLDACRTRSKELEGLAEIASFSTCSHHRGPAGLESAVRCSLADLWQEVALRTIRCLDQYPPQESSSDSQPFGSDVQNVNAILTCGLAHSATCEKEWIQLLSSLKAAALRSLPVPNGFPIATGLFEPLAKELTYQHNQSATSKDAFPVRLACQILAMAVWPSPEEGPVDAQQKLWGAATAKADENALDPYSELYKLFALMLNANKQQEHPDTIQIALVAVLLQTPVRLLLRFLDQASFSLKSWLEERGYLLRGPKFWVELASRAQELYDTNTDNLDVLKPLLLASIAQTKSAGTHSLSTWKEALSNLDHTQLSKELPNAIKHLTDCATEGVKSSIHEDAAGHLPPSSSSAKVEATTNPFSALPPNDSKLVAMRPTAAVIEERPPTKRVDDMSFRLPSQPYQNDGRVAQISPHIAVSEDLPSSPPELPQLQSSAQKQQDERVIEEGIIAALTPADELLHLNSSPTPASRPRSSRSDTAIRDKAKKTPVKVAAARNITSDPANKTKTKVVEVATTESLAQKGRSPEISSKHFPLLISDDDNHAKLRRVRQETSTERGAATLPNPTSIFIDNVEKEPLKTRKRTSNEVEIVEPASKRRSSRQSRRNGPNMLAPQLTGGQRTTDSSQTSPARRGRGRPRKDQSEVAIREPTSAGVVDVPNSSIQDDEITDCIILAASPAKATRTKTAEPKAPEGLPKAGKHRVLDETTTNRQTRKRRRGSLTLNIPPRSRSSFVQVIEAQSGPIDLEENTPSERPGARHASRSQSIPSSPSSQLVRLPDSAGGETPATPAPKRQKISKVARKDMHAGDENSGDGIMSHLTTPGSPGAVLSATAQVIMTRLKGLLGDVQKAVLGRAEAREITRTLHQLGPAVDAAEDRGRERADQVGE